MMKKIITVIVILHSQCLLNTWLECLIINLALITNKRHSTGKEACLNLLTLWVEAAKFIQLKNINRSLSNKASNSLLSGNNQVCKRLQA
jgi:hypothetical protein